MSNFDPKQLAKSVAKTSLEVVKGSRQETTRQGMSGEIARGQTVELGKMSQEAAQLEKRWGKFYRHAEQLRKEEKTLHQDKEKELILQVQALQEELNQMATATQNLEKEVEKTIYQTPVKAGTYHISFFEKLRHFIKAFRGRIEDSAACLAAFNKRSKMRNYYWAQVRKSGSMFMLSGERTLATSVG